VLLELRIENLLLIERAELRLGPGLNAITGETGAGKTVLAHSLDLLMGGRARPQIVRPGAEEAWVEGTFTVPPEALDAPELREIAERLPAEAEEVTLGRRVGSSGRTSAFVAGRSASAADLQALGARLLAFYGQHEHRKLTLASAQLEVLDGFAGAEHLARRRAYEAAHAETRAIAAELSELREREGARERDLDLLRFELAEIEAASPDPAERVELASERERLRHAEGLRLAALGGLNALAGADDDAGTGAQLAAAEAALSGPSGVDARLDALAERAGGLAVEAVDLGAELRAYLDAAEAEPGRLEAVEDRLAALERLERKHGGSLEAVIEHAARCQGEIARLENAGELADELRARLGEAEARRAELARKLSATRRRAAKQLEKRVAAELAQLAMEGATLEVHLEPHADGYGAAGAEAVELRVATNPGMPVSPLRDAASGGELSRVMLALSGLGSASGAPTLVFDEIDAGVGGATARAVGARLRELGSERQVLCITHLPQVASMAERHFRITKRAAEGATLAEVEAVAGDELVAEIVRMLGARSGDSAAEGHARELLAAA
jgi:DNA repair protein RecN (Recombination protein N)